MLIWNVYIENFNARKIDIYNVFDHLNFKKDIIDAFTEYWDEEDIVESLKKFKERAKRLAQYYFHHKCEYEIILSDWPPAPEGKFNKEKVSVYDQLELNWDAFMKHTISALLNKNI